jgi:hypothetical protein
MRSVEAPAVVAQEEAVSATFADTGTDLSWVTFSSDDGERCDGTDGADCPLEAVARSVWARTCEHAEETWLHCAAHRDMVRDMCQGGTYCTVCGTPGLLLRIEPIR